MQIVVIGSARVNGLIKLYSRVLTAFTVDLTAYRVDSTTITVDRTQI